MTTEEIRDIVIDEHVEDITKWVIKDPGSLAIWLRSILKIDNMSRDELLNEYSHIQEYIEEGDND